MVVGRPVGGFLLLTLDVNGTNELVVAREVMDMLICEENWWEWAKSRRCSVDLQVSECSAHNAGLYHFEVIKWTVSYTQIKSSLAGYTSHFTSLTYCLPVRC